MGQVFMCLFGKNSNVDPDRLKGSYPRCGGPSIGICEAQNCRNGTVPSYPAEHIIGYENRPIMWTCSTYERYREKLSD